MFSFTVNPNQKQNPLLRCLRGIRYSFVESIAPAHYVLSESTCCLILSIKYHVINSSYIYERISELKKAYQLKILIVLVDHIVYEPSIKELSLLCIRTNFTMMLAWTFEEAARHIENYRVNADSTADLIMGRTNEEKNKSSNNQQCLVEALTSVKAVNRTDAVTLLSTFSTLHDITKASLDELSICPGISSVKASRLNAFFSKSFIAQNE